ncbi:MAG: hypothetical protein KDE27_13340, partial [Planctomycetes bacterium]|nr:hypothetical protein [Planctomycetota bacterium]
MRLPVRIVTIVLLLLGLAALLCRVAWVGDDALITLRTVYHWSLGYGPVWNVAERVQTYTHPLWMLLLALAHVLSGEFFYGTIVLSLVTALLAALVLMLSARTALAAIAVAALLVGSNGFVNFATSGLEN